MDSTSHWQRCVRISIVVIALQGIGVVALAGQQLTIDSTTVKVGEPEAPVVQRLSQQFVLKRIDRGWSVQPRERTPTVPGISIQTADGRIEGVMFLWGPGFVPTAEQIVGHLAEALPAGTRCEVRNAMVRQEGGRVRTLEWHCSTYTVSVITGLWPQGNTISISVQKRRRRTI